MSNQKREWWRTVSLPKPQTVVEGKLVNRAARRRFFSAARAAFKRDKTVPPELLQEGEQLVKPTKPTPGPT